MPYRLRSIRDCIKCNLNNCLEESVSNDDEYGNDKKKETLRFVHHVNLLFFLEI